MVALARANETRLDRAGVKHRLARKEITIAEALNEPCCVKMTVFELLCAQKQWGTTRTATALAHVGIAQRREIGNLTQRQRSLLAQACEPQWIPH